MRAFAAASTGRRPRLARYQHQRTAVHVGMLLLPELGEPEMAQRADDLLALHPVRVDVAAAAEALPVQRGTVIKPVHDVPVTRGLLL